MFIFCNIYLVDKINNWYCRKFYEKFQLTTPYWSMISSLLHLVGLRPRVYYTLTNFRGGGGGGGQGPPLNKPMYAGILIRNIYTMIHGTFSMAIDCANSHQNDTTIPIA